MASGLAKGLNLHHGGERQFRVRNATACTLDWILLWLCLHLSDWVLTCCAACSPIRPPRVSPVLFCCVPQFQSFTDRINAIDIDVAHRIREVEVSPSDENDSFFNEALNRWRELVRARTGATLIAYFCITHSLAMLPCHCQVRIQ